MKREPRIITDRMKWIFALSILIFVAHDIEEVITGFPEIDSWAFFITSPLIFFPEQTAIFTAFLSMFVLLLIVSFLLLLGEEWRLRFLMVFGLVYVFELHHAYKAIIAGGYYPGLITALLLYAIGYMYWKELVAITRKKPIELYEQNAIHK